MEAAAAERARGPAVVNRGGIDPDRARVALELLEGNAAVLSRIARRHSLCREDADDALQRATLILLTKGPPIDPGRLIAWMAVVTKHEAIAVRRTRERFLCCLAPADAGPAVDRLDAVAHDGPDPAECAERRERLDRARAALAALKANERIAILLQAQGYSYVEICELCGWTYTKVNRCLAEGRAALRGARSSPAAAGRPGP